MNKHFTFYDRVLLQHFIESHPKCTAIEVADQLGKSRSAIYYELKHNTYVFVSNSSKSNGNNLKYTCPYLKRVPFCCNCCARTRCSHRCREYDAYKAHEKATRLLVSSRVDTTTRKETIDILNKTVSQLIIDGLSIHVAMISVNRCDRSESSIRRYVNKGLLTAKRHHLPNSMAYKVKQEYNYPCKRINVNVLYKRTYQDYLQYIAANPNAKVVQIDSVIGKRSDKYALLTIFFLNSKFQLAIKYYRKNSSVNSVLLKLHDSALALGYKLFDVILTDNGTEFINLPAIETTDDEAWRFKVFYCDPYRSYQKAECERNHGFIRRIFRKGKSFNTIPQEDFDMALSHINSYPRGSLNNRTPYDLFTLEYDSIIPLSFNIDKIALSDLRMLPIV